MKKDLIVIGAGPCGATAAIYAKRAGLDVLVIDSGASALLKADKIENYYGFESVSGKELFEKGLMQLRRLKVETVFRQALSAVYGDRPAALHCHRKASPQHHSNGTAALSRSPNPRS